MVSATIQAALGWLQAQIGKPYCDGISCGGNRFGPDCYDCSGLVTTFAQQAGLGSVPTVTTSQWPAFQHLQQADTQPGDLVYYNVFSSMNSEPTPNHVGICINVGCTQMIDATHCGSTVKADTTDPTGWATIAGFARIIPGGSGASGLGGGQGADSGCLAHLPLVGCVLSKSNQKALVGGLVIVAGMAVTGVGTILLVVYGLRRSGAMDVLSLVPGVGGVAARVLR